MRYVRGEIYFPVVIGIHLVIWAVDLLLLEGSPVLVAGESPVQRVLGEIMSSWVVTVFGFNLLMATRASWVERLFGGLDKMYVIHRRSGIVAAVLLLLHFGTVPRHPEFSAGKPMGFIAMALILLGIAFAAAPLMKRKLAYHKWQGGHRLMGLFFVVGVAHAAFVPTLISRLPLVRVYVVGMALVGFASWIYRAVIFHLVRRPLTYKVTEVQRHGKSVVKIHMAPEGPALRHRAGQFAFFAFEAIAPRESHPFTIASAEAEDQLRLVVKAAGDFTGDLVARVAVGDLVKVEGPYGALTAQPDAKSQVWIAGGIGITPFLALARSLADGASGVKLIWSVSSAEEAYFDDELMQLAATVPGLEYTLWESNEQGLLTVQGAGGKDALAGKDVYICGPAAMRDGLIKQLAKLGTSRNQIHSEEFSFR